MVVEKVKGLKKGHGFDALKGEYGDMFAKGIVDAAKVTRSALQNAASIAAMVLTTETLITDLPEKHKAAAPAGGGGYGGDMDYYFAHGMQWTLLVSESELPPDAASGTEPGPRRVSANDTLSARVTDCVVRTFEAAVVDFELYAGAGKR